jgi:hypothetical protein
LRIFKTTEYLAVVSEGMAEVPINIVRAMNEVEKIVKIEEQALSPKEQDLLRFYLLQIARLTGENTSVQDKFKSE